MVHDISTELVRALVAALVERSPAASHVTEAAEVMELREEAEEAAAATQELLGAVLQLARTHVSVAVRLAQAGGAVALLPLLAPAGSSGRRTEAAAALTLLCGAHVGPRLWIEPLLNFKDPFSNPR